MNFARGELNDSTRMNLALILVNTSHAPSLVISNFLALLSSGSAPAWLRASASSRLSAQLPRPGGVRALLLIVIGPGAAAGGDDEVGIKKLDMVSRLLSAKPSGQIQEEVRKNCAAQTANN